MSVIFISIQGKTYGGGLFVNFGCVNVLDEVVAEQSHREVVVGANRAREN